MYYTDALKTLFPVLNWFKQGPEQWQQRYCFCHVKHWKCPDHYACSRVRVGSRIISVKSAYRGTVLLLKTYIVLRKNPPKIKRGNISGGPRDVAAVMVGAIVDTI